MAVERGDLSSFTCIASQVQYFTPIPNLNLLIVHPILVNRFNRDNIDDMFLTYRKYEVRCQCLGQGRSALEFQSWLRLWAGESDWLHY